MNGAALDLHSTRGFTALICASNRGHLEIVRFLCMNGAALDLQTADERTALNLARRHRHREIVAVLRECGAL